MTILGIRPLNADDYEVQNPPSGSREIWLVDVEDVDGSTLRRVIKVDTLYGVVREHALYDGDGVALLRAQLSNYRNCNGAKLPHEVKISFPVHETELTLTFNNVETNCSIPQVVWTPPRGANLEYVDVGDMVRRQLEYDNQNRWNGDADQQQKREPYDQSNEEPVPPFLQTGQSNNLGEAPEYDDPTATPIFDIPRRPRRSGLRRLWPWGSG